MRLGFDSRRERISDASPGWVSSIKNISWLLVPADQFFLGPDVAVIMECKQLVMDFGKISLPYEANRIADQLAKNSFTTRSSYSWDDAILDFISHLLVNHMSSI